MEWAGVLWFFQRRCLRKIEASRNKENYLVVMKCGTGNALIEMATTLRAREPYHVVVVPTLELLWQFVNNNFLDNGVYGPDNVGFAREAAQYDLFAFYSYEQNTLQDELSRISGIFDLSLDQHRALTNRIEFGTDVSADDNFLEAMRSEYNEWPFYSNAEWKKLGHHQSIGQMHYFTRKFAFCGHALLDLFDDGEWTAARDSSQRILRDQYRAFTEPLLAHRARHIQRVKRKHLQETSQLKAPFVQGRSGNQRKVPSAKLPYFTNCFAWENDSSGDDESSSDEEFIDKAWERNGCEMWSTKYGTSYKSKRHFRYPNPFNKESCKLRGPSEPGRPARPTRPARFSPA